MNKAKAEKVVAGVEKQFKLYIEAGYPKPFLFDGSHEDLREGSWVISWEDGPDEWAYRMEPTKVPGAFLDAVNSFTAGVFDD